jgi:hypothetical protein
LNKFINVERAIGKQNKIAKNTLVMFLCNDEGEIANNQCSQHRTIIAALDPPAVGDCFHWQFHHRCQISLADGIYWLIGKLILVSNQQLSSLMPEVMGTFGSKFSPK